MIEPAMPEDVASIARISRAVGQPEAGSGADPAYVSHLLRNGTVRVARDGGGNVLGWGATATGPLGWMLTDLFVDPQHHGRGFGGALLRELWPDQRAGGRFTFSSRHPYALPLYVRAGLRPVWPLLYLTGPAPAGGDGPCVATAVEAGAAAAADRELTGGVRAAAYDYWSGAGVLVHRASQLVAAGVADGGTLTHLTCPGEPDATEALTAALRCLGAAEVSLCLPGPHPAVNALLRAGFRIKDHDLAMHTPDVQLPVTWVYSPGLG
ncbi:GNAT family N-acetyltransferase [Dactylosporangium sp. NPDC000244]|uniref:GNAT family N-acetyltransferase n=1 Tax=Dactylosporangium sp. NPDC000244 TaxID=3154365 RepID=UPI00332C4A2A